MSTIFWSWQSDLDARVTRNLVRDALASAISDLHAELDERHELTSDTQGVAGSPDIVATILAKIDAAAVFVGDVTPIALSPPGKAVANPNVLIELGYAKKALGLNRVILVWNTAFPGATIEQLPFDMRGRRAPLSFELAPGATTEELRAARDQLRNRLREALRASLAIAGPTGPREIPWQPSHESTPALWFDPTRELTINDSGSPGTKAVHPGPYAYVRIMPGSWSTPSNFAQDGTHPSILGPTQGYSWGSVKGGFLTYSGSVRSPERHPLVNFAVQFRATGEIWGVSPFTTSEDGERFFADAFISHAHEFIEANVEYLKRQGARGPFEIRMGATDLDGLHWVTETRWGGRPVALEDQVETTFSLAGNSEEERLTALEPAWGEIAAAFGVPQPPRSVFVQQIRGF
jgi:hypothetical protein